MHRTVFRKRIARIRERLADAPIDTLWILQPENRRYLSGFEAADGQLTESSGSLLVHRDACLLITDSRYDTEARDEARDFEVITLKKGLIESLPEILVRLGTRILGFEEDFLVWGVHRELAKRLRRLSPPVSLRPLKGVVDRMRLVKDRSELEAMERASDLMTEILDRVIAGLKPGATEKEIAWKIEGLVREAGADGLSFPSIVASGPNAALPHAVPTERKIRAREPIIFDVGARIDGYCSDMTRTVFLGEPAPRFKRIYRIVRQAQLSALREIRPGIESTRVDAAARDRIREAGFGDYFGHSLGHGVGLAVHEGPRVGRENPVRLEKGMVVTVEPGIYLPGKGGVRLEEMVVVEERGPRILTKSKHFYDFS